MEAASNIHHRLVGSCNMLVTAEPSTTTSHSASLKAEVLSGRWVAAQCKWYIWQWEMKDLRLGPIAHV